MLNVAIIGAGGIGRIHADAYRADGRATVVAVCDPVAERAQALAAEHKCRPFGSVDQMLQSSLALDAASVTTAGVDNGSHHFEPTMALLGARIPVLGEKPISNDVGEAIAMVALGREMGIPYGINLNHRFAPAARLARDWICAGRVGEVNLARITLWIGNPNESSPYLHLRALHPHSVDLLRFLCGDIARVHALMRQGAGRRTWSNLLLNLEFRSGVIGCLTGSYDTGPGWGLQHCEVVGTDAMVTIADVFELVTLTARRGAIVESHARVGGFERFDQTFQVRVSEWVDALIHKTSPEEIDGSGEDGLKAQLVIEAAVRSWEQGRVVEVEEVAAAAISGRGSLSASSGNPKPP